nr:acyltransferase [Acuticoccus yangtzensis]
MRGLAALAVTWFHLTGGHESVIRMSGYYGWLGVEVFFVISGFVIPLSIARGFGTFRLADVPDYLIRRLVRLEPPYLVSVLMVVVLWELSALAPGFAGGDPTWSIGQIIAHVAYAIPLTAYDWLQPVYWTLAYEFVFYIAVGLLFGAIAAAPLVWIATATITVLAALGPLPPLSLLFIMGIAVFRRLQYGDPLALTAASVAAAGLMMAYEGHGLKAAVGAAAAALILTTIRLSAPRLIARPLLWLGAMSYSLYLVHVPIGGRVVNLGRRFVPDTAAGELALSLTALAVSLAAATLFYHVVEKPAIRASHRVRERKKARAAVT